MEKFYECLNKFLEIAQNLQEPIGNINYRKLTFKEGNKYVKVMAGTYVHCFVSKSNGDVLKAASWATPAKHARGNIFNKDNGAGAINKYGTNYLK